jgi:hypothetical protein
MAAANMDTQLADIPTVAEMNARTLAAADYFDVDNDTVDANVIEIMAGTLTQTSAGYLAAGFSHHYDVAIPGYTMNEGNVNAILGTAVTQTSSGYLAGAFTNFFDVAAPVKDVNDVGVAGTPLTQADIRTAVGLASANLDTQLSYIPTVAEFNARTLASTDYFVAATDVVTNVTTVQTVVGSSDATLANQNTIISTIKDILVDTGTTLPAQITALTITAGSGSETYVATVQTAGVPVAGVECWVSTDIAGTNVVAGTETTDDFGNVTFYLDVGSYYLWRDSTTDSFPNPTAFTVS